MSTRWIGACSGALLAAAPLSGQVCVPDYLAGEVLPWPVGGVVDFDSWDPDGAGPQTRELLLAGSFGQVGGLPSAYLAGWNGAQWRQFPSNLNAYAEAVLAWDFDGAGPAPVQIVLGGDFWLDGFAPLNYIAVWGGGAWHPMASGFDSTVHDLVQWDQDGPGPGGNTLVAGGGFEHTGTAVCAHIATWNGIGWSQLGGGTTGTVYDLCVYDADGNGPQKPLLIVAGELTAAGAVPVEHIAAWNGTAWSPMNGGLGVATAADVAGMSSWDPDGAGPLNPQLMVAGRFTVAGTTPVQNVARWDGSDWFAMGTGLDAAARCATTWDLDGTGPLNSVFVVGGDFVNAGGNAVQHLAAWDGSAWSPVNGGLYSTSGSASVYALTEWSPEAGAWPGHELVAAGGFSRMGPSPGLAVTGPAALSGSAWHSFGTGFDASVRDVVNYDADGSGPQPPGLVVCGTFNSVSTLDARRIARWDGEAWHAMGSAPDNSVDAICLWSPGGPPRIVAGGQFVSIGGVNAAHVASWDGAEWNPMGAGTSGLVRDVIEYDRDGAGGAAPLAVAAGAFLMAGGAPAVGVASWNGSAWNALGTGLSTAAWSLVQYDPDHAGPLPTDLIVGGAFLTAGGVTVNRVARWDGTAWSALGGGITGGLAVETLGVWDRDGSGGPGAPEIVAAGGFNIAGPTGTLSRIARFDGSAWQPMGAGVDGAVFGFGERVSAPGIHELLVGGSFMKAGGVTRPRFARWDGSAWLSTGGPQLDQSAYAFAPVDGTGSQIVWIATGDSDIGPGHFAFLAQWGCESVVPCYPDCNSDGALNLADFGCFQTKFAMGDPYADCNGDGVRNLSDFGCFQTKFALGCP